MSKKKAANLAKAHEQCDLGKILEAAKLGLPLAQGQPEGQMAEKYCFGTGGFEQDHEKAVEFARLAAEEGDRLGQYQLGCAYYAGEGVDQDSSHAADWFELAAEQGSAYAMLFIGRILYTAAKIPLTLLTNGSVKGPKQVLR
jgi:TPR repeat protein